MEGHIKTKVKCHYFNNGKRYPYEDVGCMLAHETAEVCKFREICTKEKCQFTHKNMVNENYEIENTSEYEESEEHFLCISCEEFYGDLEDLIDHYGDTAHNIED